MLLGGALSRRARIGGGSTVGGHFGIALDRRLLERLGRGRPVALVSGTNGKTTTTRLLVEALGGPARVASSAAGANMAAGIVSALAVDLDLPAALEVDEGHLPDVLSALRPAVVVLLNLSRDQLDRTSEVRLLAERWRQSLEHYEGTVVANADDPLVAYAASSARDTRFVSAGSRWHLDAYHCPVCGGSISFAENGSWACSCGFARPETSAGLEGDRLVVAGGASHQVQLALPGRFNLANAAIAVVAAEVLGVELGEALRRVASVDEVAGRFSSRRYGEQEIRLLLAKNPAGWSELLDLLATGSGPVVIGINARDADGHDPSWLFDVPFELLSGREVVATGERASDLALRLLHAGVAHRTVHDQRAAIEAAGAAVIDYVGNYTAFQQLRRALATKPSAPRASAGTGLGPVTPARPVIGQGAARRDSALRVVVVHPELLGTYGDVGNGRVLANRASWRGIESELVLAYSREQLPRSGDLYVLGGGEDGPQVTAAAALRDGALGEALEAGAGIFAVCAGFQILGQHFPGPNGEPVPGIGLLDIETVRGGPRAVGELAVETTIAGATAELTGFENHAGRTRLGEGVEPLGAVRAGIGNGPAAVDGAKWGRVIGTYLHGPALARNPLLADALLSLATGRVLEPLDDAEEEQLRAERFAALGRRRPPRRKSRRRHDR